MNHRPAVRPSPRRRRTPVERSATGLPGARPPPLHASGVVVVGPAAVRAAQTRSFSSSRSTGGGLPPHPSLCPLKEEDKAAA